jgi:transposase
MRQIAKVLGVNPSTAHRIARKLGITTPREQLKAQALALYSQGISATQIAKMLGAPRGTVIRWVSATNGAAPATNESRAQQMSQTPATNESRAQQMSQTPATNESRAQQMSQTQSEAVAALYNAGYSIRQIASQLGISVAAAHKLIKESGIQLRSRGRQPALTNDQRQALLSLLANPATQHLPAKKLYAALCEQTPPPHPSYAAVYRFLATSVPELYRRKPKQRFLHAHHPTTLSPGEQWLIDRYRADLFVLDPATGECARPECIVIIDRATRAILAIGAAYRPDEATIRKRFHYDAHLVGSALLQAIRGEITGIPHFPQSLILDWGKTEGAHRIQEYLEYHRVQIRKAAPYTPHDKAEIEGGVIAHIHTQLEARLPGYCGPDNRPNTMPAAWDGKPRRVITAKGVYYTDAAGRPLLDIDEFNRELQAYARWWNEQPCSDDPRHRFVPRIERLKPLLQKLDALQTNLHYAETYLLPVAIRTVYEDGTISLYNRRYYHPALVALRTLHGKDAKVAVRYSLTNRDTVYLFAYDQRTGNATLEWLWHYDNPQTPSPHPWYRSQATYYNRDDHTEDDPAHLAWVRFTRAVNQAARDAAKRLRAEPIADPNLAFNYIAAFIWDTVEQHLHTLNPLPSHHAPAAQGAEAGDNGNEDATPAPNATDGNAHALISPEPQQQLNLLEIERAVMRKRREQAKRFWGL